MTLKFHNEMVYTTQQVAEMHETESKIISNNFSRNKDRYQKGKHYYLLEGEELRAFKSKVEDFDLALNMKKLYLWTNEGLLLHVKSLNTDKAWAVYYNMIKALLDS